MLSMVGKIYAEILVDGIRRVTEGLIDDEQGGFRAGRGCVDQIFTLKQEKALWRVLRMYDVCGKLLNEIKSMYDSSLACVRVKGVRVSVSGSIVV